MMRTVEWLTEKYPGWPEMVGTFWDDVRGGRDVNNAGLVPVCNLCQVACMFQDEHGPMIEGPVTLDGRAYWFCSRPCREIFEAEPDKYKGGKTIVDLVLDGAHAGRPGRVPEVDGDQRSDAGRRPVRAQRRMTARRGGM